MVLLHDFLIYAVCPIFRSIMSNPVQKTQRHNNYLGLANIVVYFIRFVNVFVIHLIIAVKTNKFTDNKRLDNGCLVVGTSVKPVILS